MHPQPSAHERRSLWMLHPHVIATARRRGWRWLTTIYSDDPIRLALNRGFAHIIIALVFISVILIFAAFASGEIATVIVTIFSVPVQVFTWWLNRRGTTYGATLYVLWVIAAIVLASPPATYAGVDTPIPLLLILPVIIATIFIRPQAGLWALILTMTVLGVQLYSSDVPHPYIERFLTIGTIDLVGITIFLMMGASIFWRTLHASTAANEALRRQQEQFHYAALATQDAIYDWDLRTNMVLRNEAYKRFYALDDPKTAVVTWWEKHVHPDDYGRVTASMRSAFQSHSHFWSDEYRLRRVDGQYATVVDRAYVLYDPAGQPVRMIGAMTDITEHKQTEARMRALIDAFPDMIVRYDREGRYLEIKASPSIPLNYAVPDAIGHTVWEMLPHDPKLAEDIVHTIEKVLDTGEMVVQEYPLIYDGKTIYRERRTVPADSDEVMMLIRDITARKQNEARMRALIDAIPDMIVRHDREGRYLEIKAAPSIPLNYAIPDAIGHTVWEMLPHDPKLAEELVRSIEKVLNTHEMDVREYQLVVDGQIIYQEARTVPADSNEVTMLIRDITERKQAEAEHLELALARERAELLKEFVDTISHDLKTPLTIINTSLYLLEKATDPENQRVKVELIKEQVQRLGKLIQDILTLSRLDTLPDFIAHALDINRVLLQVHAQLNAVAEERQLTLKMNLDPNVTPVWGNGEDLQRAFTNLVENALHYTLADGMVTIRTFEQANRITVEVSDTGIGIAEADLHHVFEHFYRADEARSVDTGGTGLGLAIVKKIVNQHRGSIEVESRVGQGSIFRVTLPAAPKNT
jgi:PAS domain S-box-containing protein